MNSTTIEYLQLNIIHAWVILYENVLTRTYPESHSTKMFIGEQ